MDFSSGLLVKTWGLSLIPGQGNKIPHASQMPPEQKIKQKQKQYCNNFNKDLKNGPQQKKKKIFKVTCEGETIQPLPSPFYSNILWDCLAGGFCSSYIRSHRQSCGLDFLSGGGILIWAFPAEARPHIIWNK